MYYSMIFIQCYYLVSNSGVLKCFWLFSTRKQGCSTKMLVKIHNRACKSWELKYCFKQSRQYYIGFIDNHFQPSPNAAGLPSWLMFYKWVTKIVYKSVTVGDGWQRMASQSHHQSPYSSHTHRKSFSLLNFFDACF